MDRKLQHVIPNCYLKAWCDPRTPKGHSPYIWRISKDGKRKQKRSPEKSFRANDRYTITLADGSRDLALEDSLSSIEDDFAKVLTRVCRRETLEERDRACLCFFAAVMTSRTLAFGEHWREFFQTLNRQVSKQEKKHQSEPSSSLETARLVALAPQFAVASSISAAAPLLFRMCMTVLYTEDEIGFITSDNPCIFYNPSAYKMPPGLRNPALSQTDIEITLPLTPQHLLLISHRPFPHYQRAAPEALDIVNSRTRWACTAEFVSWKGETKPCWFKSGSLPEDAWENTEEGKRGLAQLEKYRTYARQFAERRKIASLGRCSSDAES
jgi:Protein of unknown function (DUF4238)